MKPFRRKVTAETRDQLVQIFLHMGKDVAAEECIAHGLHRNYAEAEVSFRGLRPKHQDAGSGTGGGRVDHDDPRWAWAIERGPVIA
jgi:hypothetical protein